MDVPGYAAIGGSGCYSNHMDLIRNEDDEQQLKDVEDHLNETANDEEPIEEVTYEVSKNEINDKEDSPNYNYNADLAEIEEDLHMIDSDFEK
jgi:DNA-binding ferritin-like protein